jgi:hypothetical protein
MSAARHHQQMMPDRPAKPQKRTPLCEPSSFGKNEIVVISSDEEEGEMSLKPVNGRKRRIVDISSGSEVDKVKAQKRTHLSQDHGARVTSMSTTLLNHPPNETLTEASSISAVRGLNSVKPALPTGKPLVQPIGKYCIVIGRMSSNKGLRSTFKDGKKVQLDQAGNITKKRSEGLVIGRRLGENAPQPIQWNVLESTWHKQLSGTELSWRKNKSGQARMVTDIKAFFTNIPQGSDVTICIRCLDGLILNVASFFEFVSFVVRDCKLNALVIFQIYKFTPYLNHPRMVPFLGLGSVIPFTGAELRRYDKRREDPSGEIEQLVKCLTALRDRKRGTNLGLQNRNKLPDADMFGAIDIGGEVPPDSSDVEDSISSE